MKLTPSLRFIDTDKAEICSGGGCLVIFGIPFFAAGMFLLLASLNIIPFSNANEIPWFGFIIIFFMGSVFSAVGASIIFLRKAILFDRALKSVTEENRFLGYIKRKEMRLQNFSVVTIRRISGDSDTSDSFPVALEGAEAEKKLKVYTSFNLGESIELADSLANFLGLPCEDRTTQNVRTVRSAAAKVGALPQERIEALAQKGAVPAAPSVLRSVVTDRNGELTFLLPRYFPVLPGVIIWLIFMIVVENVFHLSNFWTGVFKSITAPRGQAHLLIENPGDAFGLVFFGFLTFAAVVAPIFRFLAHSGGTKKEGERLLVSAQGLAYKNKKIPAEDILAVDVVLSASVLKNVQTEENPYALADASLMRSLGKRFIKMLSEGLKYSNRLQIKTNREIIEIPTGLSAEETNYVRALIETRLKKV
jgi:hypothetical protein